MYMGVIGNSPEGEILRELAGTRVLVTGLTRDIGVDVARAFADVRCRLVVQTNDLTPDMTALVALLSQSAAELKLYTDPIRSADPAIRFAQGCQQAFGGLDTVVNLQTITREEMRLVASEADVERLITAKLTPRTTAERPSGEAVDLNTFLASLTVGQPIRIAGKRRNKRREIVAKRLRA